MNFEREFFLDEVRDGYFVPSMMKKAWASSMRNYEKLHDICKKYDIKIYASWGTLIAAIRHGGYIPWDDDLDLMMFREDLQKLESVLKTEKDLGDYHLQDYHVTMGDNMVRQWLEKSIYIYDPSEWQVRLGFPFGDVVDIFVIDHIPRDMETRVHQAEVIGACNKLQLLARDIYGDSSVRKRFKESKEFTEALEEVERLTGRKISLNSYSPIRVQIVDIMDKHIASYANGRYEDEGVADIANYLGNKDRLLPKEYFRDHIDVPYEMTTIPVPIGYDSILRRYYGEYMVPQIAVDYGHEYPFYERYAKILKEKFGFELLKYSFDEKVYDSVRAGRIDRISIQDTINQMRNLLGEAHEYILGSIGDAEKTDEVLEILGSCQNLAIQLGNKAEVRMNDSQNLISGIEKYCETIYVIYEGLVNDSGEIDIDVVRTELSNFDKILDDINIGFEDELSEILILCDRAKNWDALDDIWRMYTEDARYHVSVIALPYKYKDATWTVPDGEWECDTDGYPDYVKITDYQQYDIEGIHPDEIIYTFPYDSYSDIVAPNPEYYTDRLSIYTDRMVFVQPFVLREIQQGDNRSRYTLGRFISNPGSVYADRIVVQSDQMKAVYEEILDNLTDKIDWKEKLVTRDEEYSRAGALNKTESSDVKSILVYFSASMIYDHEASLKKISDVIDMMEEKSGEIQPVWVEDPYAEKILKPYRPSMWDEYKKILDKIEKSSSWIVDDGADVDGIARKCAGMYGDAGILMNKCRMYGKPVMWENPDIGIEGE